MSSRTLATGTTQAPDVLSFGNEFTRIDLDPNDGRILQIHDGRHDHDLVVEPRLAENFRLLVPLPGYRGHYLFGRGQSVSAIIQDDDQQVTVRWDRLTSAHGSFDLDVSLHIRVDADGDVSFRTEVQNRSSHTIEEVHNVMLGGLGVPAPRRADWRMHYAGGGGQGREVPIFEQFPGSYLGPELPVWIGGYHGELQLPWLDFSDRAAGYGWYFGNHDPEARQSYAFSELNPCTTRRGDSGEQYWPDPDQVGDTPVGMSLSWASIPFIEPGATWAGPEIVLHVHDGSWWEAARYFRAWHDQVSPAPQQRSWLYDEDAWQSTIISYPDDTIGYRFSDIPDLARAAADAGIHVLQLDGWDIGGIDRDYPRYEPDPRLGTWEDLRRAIAECHELGVKVLLFSNLQWVNMETDWFDDQLSALVSRDPYGNVRGGMGWHYRTILGLTAQCIHRMIPANCTRPEFQDIILSQLQNIVDFGADGTQLDKVGAMGEIDYSPDNPTDRDRSGPEGVRATLERFVCKARAVNPDFAIASEVHWDKIINMVDASYSRFWATDHLPTFAAAFPEYRQSCCITGRWDYGLVNNCIRYGHIINLEGDCLHGDARSMPELAEYVAEVLRLRRSLRHLIWDSRLIDPSTITITGSSELRTALHESVADGRHTVVLNHFSPDPQTVTVQAEGSRSAVVHRPYRAATTVSLPAEVTVRRDQVVIIELLSD